MRRRPAYLATLAAYKDTHLIKVLTGIRRCGKSMLLESFQEELLSLGVRKEQIIAINFEDLDFTPLCTAESLHAHVTRQLLGDSMNYIFLDEVQHVTDFQKAVDSLFLRKNVDLYITGSNAALLSGELATLLSGRYVEIHVLPLSFSEYLDFTDTDTDADTNRKFTEYLQFSSFPFTCELHRDKNRIREYLGGIFNTVVLKDIVARKNVADVLMLQDVIRFLFDNIGNILSTKKISDTITSSGRKISTHTVESYLVALSDSFIVYRCSRFDVKGKQYLKTGAKYYLVDMGLRWYLLGNKDMDRGFILENIVYLELVRRGFAVFVGKSGDAEIDFITQKGDECAYYQVALTVRDAATLERELLSLRRIRDHYPKYLLTLDDDPSVSYDGIQRVNVVDWLLA
jgi:predicted AAA+ superfamily ATPase